MDARRYIDEMNLSILLNKNSNLEKPIIHNSHTPPVH